MIKVLFITARSDIGGGPKHLADILLGIQNSYPNVQSFVAAPDEEPFAKIFQDRSVDFIEIPRRRFSFMSFLQLLFFCKSNEINCVHSHGRGAGYYSRLLGLFSLRIIHTLHGLHVDKSISGRLKLFFDIFLSPLTDTLIHVSQEESARSLQMGMNPRASIVVRNGVDIHGINLKFNELDPLAARKHFKLPTDKIILGALARHDFAKGIDLLIDLANSGVPENYLFAIAGDGELLEKNRGMIKNNSVILLGKTLEPLTFLKAIDVFVSFSRWEGLPLAVLEALSCGLPCLLSDVTGNRELAEFCNLFRCDDDESFWIKLKSVKFTNKEKFYQEFNLDQMINSTVRLYST